MSPAWFMEASLNGGVFYKYMRLNPGSWWIKREFTYAEICEDDTEALEDYWMRTYGTK